MFLHIPLYQQKPFRAKVTLFSNPHSNEEAPLANTVTLVPTFGIKGKLKRHTERHEKKQDRTVGIQAQEKVPGIEGDAIANEGSSSVGELVTS